MIKIKPGVRLTGLRPEVLLGVQAADSVYAKYGLDCVITSAVDGIHSKGSLHYTGQAVDLRTRDSGAKINEIVRDIKEALAENYDVVLEKDHLHLEFQPK